MKKSSTTEKVHRTAKEKRATAARTASWRERKANELIEVRELDKCLSEAIAIHARSMTPAAQKAFLAQIICLAQDGLVFQGHAKANARNRLVDRLSYWLGSEVTSGSVRAAIDRKALTLTKPTVAA